MGSALETLFVAPGMIHGGHEWKEMCETLELAVKSNVTGALASYEESTCEWNEFAGFLVLIAHMMVYGFVLYTAAELIGEGSELLLLIPSMRGLTGSCILPIMGAVPDGIMVLFSGLGDNAQEELRVGMGALAGSTVMLLTVPWFLATLGGRVDLSEEDLEPRYRKHWVMYKGERKKRKLGNARGKPALFLSGVRARPVIRRSGYIMALTSLPYLIIEIPSFILSAGDTKEVDRKDQADFVESFAVIGLVLSFFFFCSYLAYCWIQSKNNDLEDTAVEVVATSKIDQMIDQQVQAGNLDIVTAFLGELERAESLRMGMEMERVSEDAESGTIHTPLTSSPTKVEEEKDISMGDHLLKRIKLFVYDFFKKYAKQYKDRCTPHDFPALMRDMGLELDNRLIHEELKKLVSDDGWIHFKQLASHMPFFILEYGKRQRFSRSVVHVKDVSRKRGSSFVHPKKSLDRVFREIRSTRKDDDEENKNEEKKAEEEEEEEASGVPKVPVKLDEHILGEDMEEEEQEDESDDEDEHHNEYYMTTDEKGEPRINTRAIFKDSIIMMAKGSVLIFFFADPMVDALNDCGYRINVSPFYISFIVAPLASNASEFLAAYKIAKKKTPTTITVSYSTLIGAAIMNNTFVLGIFMLLIYVRDLAWEFTAETFCILFVEWCMLYFTSRLKVTLLDSFIVLSFFPISLFLVYMMTSVGSLD